MKKSIPFSTIILVAINVIIFFMMQSRGLISPEGIFAYGGCNYDKVMSGEWWRLVTSLFIHFNIEHLFFNMFSLFAVGSALDVKGKRIAFIIVYFVSGILANVISIFANGAPGANVVSAGASGAICGLVGYFILNTIFESERITLGSFIRPFLAVAIIVGQGVVNPAVDQAAHLGGLFIGAILGLFFCLGMRK